MRASGCLCRSFSYALWLPLLGTYLSNRHHATVTAQNATLAQLVERSFRKAQVVGSSPTGGLPA